METEDKNTGDPCYRILLPEDLTNDVKASIWDDFYESPSAAAFAEQIERFGLNQPLMRALVTARRNSSAVQRHQFASALHTMSQIDPNLLATAEKHPNVLKVLLGATVQQEKSSSPHANAPHEESAEQE